MAKGNGKGLAVVIGSEEFSGCRLIDTAGGKLPMKHLLGKVYDKRSADCQKCGVCEAFLLKLAVSAPDVVPIAVAKKMVRPHGCRATQEKIIRRVSSGMAGR